MELKPADISPEQLYKVMMTSFIPRPVSWISTVSLAGVPNLAPYALTSIVSTQPVIFQFSARKLTDTWRNATEQGSFVVNMARVEDRDAVAKTGEPFPPEVDEFVQANLTAVPSVTVGAPRLASSPISFECETVGEHQIGGSRLVLGQLTYIHIDDQVLAEDGLVDALKLNPLAKLGRTQWSALSLF